jgi:hypothetical protein
LESATRVGVAYISAAGLLGVWWSDGRVKGSSESAVRVGVAYISATGLLGVWWSDGGVGGGHWSLLLEWVWHMSQLLACWGCGGLMAGLGAGIGVGYVIFGLRQELSRTSIRTIQKYYSY